MSTATNHTNYRVEIWTGKEYQRTYVYSDGSRAEHNDAIRALWNDPDHKYEDKLQYRIVRVDKKRPMKPKVNWATSKARRLDDGLSVEAQAQRAADHYQQLRNLGQRPCQPLTQVHVFPVKPSGRGVAAEFRTLLARILTKQVALTGGSFWAKNADETRRILEGRLVEAGFEFIEVDVEDYA